MSSSREVHDVANPTNDKVIKRRGVRTRITTGQGNKKVQVKLRALHVYCGRGTPKIKILSTNRSPDLANSKQ